MSTVAVNVEIPLLGIDKLVTCVMPDTVLDNLYGENNRLASAVFMEIVEAQLGKLKCEDYYITCYTVIR